MEMSVYSHKANDRFRRDKISILEQLGICIAKKKKLKFIIRFPKKKLMRMRECY